MKKEVADKLIEAVSTSGSLLACNTEMDLAKEVSIKLLVGILQTIMLIQFRDEGLVTKTEQMDFLNKILTSAHDGVYYTLLERAFKQYPEWFDKEKSSHG